MDVNMRHGLSSQGAILVSACMGSQREQQISLTNLVDGSYLGVSQLK